MISTALSATPAPSSGGILGFDPTLILLFGLLIVVIIFMFRSSRKRRADAEKLQSQMDELSQMAPIFDPDQALADFKDFMVFFRPGDIVKFKPVGRDEYDATVADVDAGRFAPRMRDVTFDLREFSKDMDAYNRSLEDKLNDR